MGRKTKHTKTSVRRALQDADGVILGACEALGVCQSTMYNYMNRWKLWDLVQEERDDLVHLAKRGLAYHLRAIERGEAPPEWAIKFTLTTLDSQFEQKVTVDLGDARERLAHIIARRSGSGDGGGVAGEPE